MVIPPFQKQLELQNILFYFHKKIIIKLVLLRYWFNSKNIYFISKIMGLTAVTIICSVWLYIQFKAKVKVNQKFFLCSNIPNKSLNITSKDDESTHLLFKKTSLLSKYYIYIYNDSESSIFYMYIDVKEESDNIKKYRLTKKTKTDRTCRRRHRLTVIIIQK